MTFNKTFIINLIVFSVVNLTQTTVWAATKPARIFAFTPSTPQTVLKIKRASWRDPLFGNEGWTHSSDWGKFSTTKGKVITIKLVTKVQGLHPGITVWHRGKDDTAPDTYVVDHFYPQNKDFSELGAKDESTGKTIGNIAMHIITHAYDNDGHTNGYGFDSDGNKILKPPADIKGLKDKVPGQLVLTFKAPKSGSYQFVVGGYNPIKAFDGKNKHEVTATVSVAP